MISFTQVGIDSLVKALTNQRNDALDTVATLAAQTAMLEADIKDKNAQIEALQKELSAQSTKDTPEVESTPIS